MMNRLAATRIVVELAAESPIVGSIGNASSDLAAVADRPENLYVRAMGMASSFGLGLALALPSHRVVILDGDGALLMNLGSLATAAMNRARNLVHVIWDNGVWEITGGQPVASAFGADLATVARGCGFEKVDRVETLEDFRAVFGDAMRDSEPRVVVGVVESGNSTHSTPIDDRPLRTRFLASAMGKEALSSAP